MIYIYCAGKYSAEIHDLITRLDFNKIYIAYVDDSKTVLDESSYKANIFTFKKLISMWNNNDQIVIANGNPKVKSTIYNRLVENNIMPSIFIDKTSIISKSAKYKKGLIVMPYCSVSSFSELSEKNSLIPIIRKTAFGL